MVEIAPSILSADFTRLGEQVAAVESGGASYIHFDVMDGHFVPNLTIGPFIVEWVRKATNLPIDAHLMIENPDNFIGAFAKAGAGMISIHPEATYHVHRTISYIRQSGCKAGVVLNPATPLAMIEEVITDVDYVLLMSVNPGFGGQKFISSSLDKLRRLRALIQSSGSQARIEIDGGIGVENAAAVVSAGAEILVAGSAVFGKPDPGEAVRQLLNAASAGGGTLV
ncbi:MAG TPA: ribulose-phosphate 3-epimerase [Blastocatellia bacterium]|nr:ribulose-phosphate 3-epimerase [Blastocatellia bacterium]HMV81921.1 ribulose-phosphate 3-epimerase [Blastocatellia bacterium]HMX30150.1 ribulose-phosphate 3-epimerase [Blastocatellia bacterium]HMY75386.1 ribulose-phosphate 3-epimerase [Blastocatellia bacterium]HMZ16385.1 ribulose-phosphate 3-epimerase [Blastocatellia bacterium]